MNRFLTFCALLPAVLDVHAVAAANADNLLPVEQAFRVEARALDRDAVQFDFKIADDYYLYRERIKTKSTDPALTLNALDLPAGEKKHDEFLGDVEVYHHGLTATQHLTAPADLEKAALELRYQGCHQVDPKICFPPQKLALNILLPKAAVTTDAALASLSAVLIAPAGGSLLGGGPLPAEQAFVFEAIATGSDEVLARFSMPKDYYLYRDKTNFALADGQNASLGAPKWPSGKDHTDANFGTTTVYFDQVEVPIGVTRASLSAQTLAVTANFQGCLENSVCYPVMTRTVNVALPAVDATQVRAATHTTMSDEQTKIAVAPTTTGQRTAARGPESQEDHLTRVLRESSLPVIWLAFFVAGLALAFTPCVYPMIPILSGIIAGAGEGISTQRATSLSTVYVLANAFVFMIAGVIAGLLGFNLTAAFQNPWLLTAFAMLFVVLALSMFGFYELQLPSSWQAKISDISNRQKPGSIAGVAVMGALSALIVGPCVTPALAVAIGYIGKTGNPVLGGNALFALALGMGAPLIVFGATQGKLLPRAGAWMDAVKAVFGVSFLTLAIWMLARFLDTAWIMLMAGVLAVACAVYLGALERLPDGTSGWRKLWKSLGVVLLLAGAAELIGVAAGSNDLLQPLHGLSAGSGNTGGASATLPFRKIKSVTDVDRELAAAQSAGKPAMLDFYADWCVSCKEMEKFTFSKVEVQSALAGFVLLQADVTANDDTDQALMKHYGIVAPPDTLFFGADGAEKHALQLTGPEDADNFVKRITAAAK